MCSRRPLLLAVPSENLAARIVKDTGAGVVVGPGDAKGFIDGAHRLMQEQKVREDMADKGRMYAETHFDIEKITERFEAILTNI